MSRSAAFTLVEVLIAMLILAVGMVAIASVFPVAGYLQKQAADDVLALHVSRQAESVLAARKIDVSSLNPTTADIIPLNKLDLEPWTDTKKWSSEWPVSLRCHPSALDLDGDGLVNERGANVQGLAGDPEDHDFDQRVAYWVPVIQNLGNTANPEWRVFTFILRKKADATYQAARPDAEVANPDDGDGVPKVVRLDARFVRYYEIDNQNADRPGTSEIELTDAGDIGQVQLGDLVLTNQGLILKVTDIEDDLVFVNGDVRIGTLPTSTQELSALWIGLAPQTPNAPYRAIGSSSTLRIIAFGEEVVK